MAWLDCHVRYSRELPARRRLRRVTAQTLFDFARSGAVAANQIQFAKRKRSPRVFSRFDDSTLAFPYGLWINCQASASRHRLIRRAPGGGQKSENGQ